MDVSILREETTKNTIFLVGFENRKVKCIGDVCSGVPADLQDAGVHKGIRVEEADYVNLF